MTPTTTRTTPERPTSRHLALWLAVLLAGTALLSTAAHARGHEGKQGGGCKHHGAGSVEKCYSDEALEEVGVDAERREAVSTIRAASRERVEAARTALERERADLQALLEADEPDRDAVMAQADVVGALELELQKLRLDTRLSVEEILEPSERAALRAKRREKHVCGGQCSDGRCPMRGKHGGPGGHGAHDHSDDSV